MSEEINRQDLLALTADVVSSYLSARPEINTSEIGSLIQSVYHSFAIAANDTSITALPKPKPAVPINKSITPEYIVCLEDGKKLQMLKRHLKTVYNMSVEEYRERWGLGPDYPVVSPNYARRRSEIARSSGLGIHGRKRKLKVVSGEDGQISQKAVLASS